MSQLQKIPPLGYNHNLFIHSAAGDILVVSSCLFQTVLPFSTIVSVSKHMSENFPV